MAKTIDLKKVQAALDRAAPKGVSGPKDARSGRFVSAGSADEPAPYAVSPAVNGGQSNGHS